MFATLAVVVIALLVAVVASALAGSRDRESLPAASRVTEFSSFRL